VQRQGDAIPYAWMASQREQVKQLEEQLKDHEKRHDSFRNDDSDENYGDEEENAIGEVAALPERRPSRIQKQRTKPNIDFKSHLTDHK